MSTPPSGMLALVVCAGLCMALLAIEWSLICALEMQVTGSLPMSHSDNKVGQNVTMHRSGI